MTAVAIPFCWRTAPDEPQEQWRRGSHVWEGGTICDLRRRIAPSYGSTAALALAHDPELWNCDEGGNIVARVHSTDIPLFEWLPADAPPILWERYANRQRKAVLVFTFPPTKPAAATAANTASVLTLATERARARSFFQRLADPATLQPDAKGWLYLPDHPSMAMSTCRRFEGVINNEGQTVVPLLSRSLARQYEAAMLEQCEAYHNFMHIHGAHGAGKSYALYEAVCRLMAQNNKVRVIYMHDCSAWRHDPAVAIQQIAAITASGFHPDEDAAIWTAAAAVGNYMGLERLLSIVVPEYCRKRGVKIIALFDQHDGLAVNLRAQVPWSIPERVLTTLASWKGIGVTVIAASANNQYFLKVAEDGRWRRLDCFHGFTGDELDMWRRHHRFFDGPEHLAGWDGVTALIENWPLDLNEMRLDQRSTLEKTLEAHRLKRLCILAADESRHLRQRITNENKRAEYAGVILDMLVGHANITTRYMGASWLINQHTLRYNDRDDSVRPINDLARQFYLVGGYLKRIGPLGDDTVKDLLCRPMATADAKGRVLKLYLADRMVSLSTFQLQARPVLESGRLGSWTTVFNARALSLHYFPSQGVPGGLTWTASMLLVPLNSNCPGADLLLWDAEDQILVAGQVTVSRIRDQSMSFTADLQAAWQQASGARKVRVVWLAPDADFTPLHAGQYYLPLESIQADLAPLVAYFPRPRSTRRSRRSHPVAKYQA